jgi:hypothetical protein
MHEFHGDLLIGGVRIKHVHGELAEEVPRPHSREWVLAGQMHLTPEQSQLLETDRPYRLQLEDGRAGQVVVSRIVQDGKPDERLVDFQPKQAADGK